MTDPTTSPTPKISYPIRTKVIVVIVVALALSGFIVAGLNTDTSIDDDVALSGEAGDAANAGGQMQTDPDGVISRSPRRDTEVLAQASIVLRLSPGWTGELTLLPASGSALPLPDDEVRTTALNELIYEPKEGMTLERLPPGRNCVRATIWDQVQGRDTSERLESWCFDVT